MHDNTLTPENRDKFNYIAGQYGQIVKFYNVDILCPDKINEIKKMMENAAMFERFSIGTAFRLLITHLLPKDIEKIIYLDSDIILNLDIKEFWQIELGNKPMASVSTWDLGINHKEWYREHYLATSGLVGYEDYFCAATLLLNLNYIRNDEKHFHEGLEFVAKNTNCNYFDQDVYNYLYGNNYIKAAEKFDVYVVFERRDKKATQLRPAIYHYVSQSLGFNMQDIFDNLWWKYFEKTPWFTKEAIGHLYEGVRQMNIQEKRLLVNISAIMSGKTRAFFVQSNSAEAIKKIFHCKHEEEFIIADAQDSVENLINAMKLYDGKKIFFIFVINFQPLYNLLIKEGFAPGKDFVNGLDFLSDAEGVPLNSYSLVKLL